MSHRNRALLATSQRGKPIGFVIYDPADPDDRESVVECMETWMQDDRRVFSVAPSDPSIKCLAKGPKKPKG